MRLFPLLLLLACLIAPAAAQEPGAPGGYLLRTRYAGAESWLLTWEFTSTILTSGNEVVTQAEGRENVTVRPLGPDRYLYRAVGQRCLVRGTETVTPAQLSMLGAGDVYEMEIDGCGRILKVLRSPALERGYAFTFVLPEEPLLPGKVWRGKADMVLPRLGDLGLDTTLEIVDAQGDDLRLLGKTLMRWRRDRREGRTESRMTYDLKSGVLKRGRLRTNLDLEHKGVKLSQSLFFNWDLRPDAPAPPRPTDGW